MEPETKKEVINFIHSLPICNMPPFNIDPRPFLLDTDADWSPLLEFIKLYGPQIEIVYEVFSVSDSESRETIKEYLN